MAGSNGQFQIPALVKGTIDQAQKRFAVIEKEAQKLAKDVVVRGRAAQKDVTREIERIQKRGAELIEDPRIQKLRGRARSVSDEILGRLEDLQTGVLNLVGVASHEQVESVTQELRKLAKKVDGMTKSAKRGNSLS